MGRPKLNMTPDEREEHDRNKANQRKQKQRDKESKAKALEGQLSDAEIYELMDILCAKPLGEAALMLAELQRSYKKQYGIKIPRLRELSFPRYRAESETPEDYNQHCNRARKFGLILYFSMDAIRLSKARACKEKHELKEAQEAIMLGIDLKTYKEQKRAKKKIIKKKADIAKTMERIGKKPTNIDTNPAAPL